MKIKEKINKEIELMDFEIRRYGIMNFILTILVDLLMWSLIICYGYALVLFFKLVFQKIVIEKLFKKDLQKQILKAF